MKIFEKIQYTDGGPNDRGFVIGYIQANSKEHARDLLGIKHGFIDFKEISMKEYSSNKKSAYKNYKRIFNI